jgi:agmatine deiminase
MPAEWEPHAATWIGWPQNPEDWPGKFEAIEWVYTEIVRHLARVERVEILVNDEAVESRAREVLRLSHAINDRVGFHRVPTDRGWLRDSGPIFVKASPPFAKGGRKGGAPQTRKPGEPQMREGGAPTPLSSIAATCWGFNAWAKYDDWHRDELVSAAIARLLKIPNWYAQAEVDGNCRRIVLEGGSIDVNGLGCLLTTEECLLSRDVQQRNPGLSREHLEAAFANYLGVSKLIWLERGIVGDDTHGHVDDIARFVAPGAVVTVVEPDPSDPNYGPLQENLRRLRSSTDQDGNRLRVVELPMPDPVIFREQRLPASYANFYIANGLVLVPTFNDRHDRMALNILAELFPDREVVGIHCGDLIWGLGALHCMTQQQPAEIGAIRSLDGPMTRC